MGAKAAPVSALMTVSGSLDGPLCTYGDSLLSRTAFRKAVQVRHGPLLAPACL